MGRKKLPDNVFSGEDLSGRRFGIITVLKFLKRKKIPSGTRGYWLCKCDCGTERGIAGTSLRAGRTKSCGCVNLLGKPRRSGPNRKINYHGLSRTSPIYRIWSEMRRRCLSEKSLLYPDYGGRGITICERWDNFQLFHHDMIGAWKAGLSLGRINNHRGYSPANCCWQTSKEQNNNQRGNRLIRIGDETKTMAQWLEHYGISANCFYNRLKRGMTEAQAMSWPSGVPWSRPIASNTTNPCIS